MIQPLLEKVWQFLIELNVYLRYDPEILFIGIYLRVMERYIHYSFINNSQRLETTQVFIRRRINKQTGVSIEYILRNIKEQTNNTHNTNEFQKHYAG